MSMKFLRILVLAGLLGGVALSRPATASNYVQIQTGTIQSIDYLHHTLTVNGHVLQVSEATAYSGVQGFNLLTIGLKVRYVLNGSAGKNSNAVVQIVVLP